MLCFSVKFYRIVQSSFSSQRLGDLFYQFDVCNEIDTITSFFLLFCYGDTLGNIFIKYKLFSGNGESAVSNTDFNQSQI